MTNETDKRIAQLETQVVTLASRLNQFYRLIAYTTLQQGRASGDLDNNVKLKLERVISGEGHVKEWKIVDGETIEPILVGESK